MSWTITSEQRAAIDGVFSQFTNTTPGCAIAIYRGSEIEFSNGYGMANLELDAPILPSSIFHVASISKQFTAMCIALLQEDGLVDVNQPVQTYIPELPVYNHEILVRHLVHHVSGLRDQWMLVRLAGWRSHDVVTEDDCFGLVRRQQDLNFVPGEKYTYCNSGYTMMAMIVKRVTGKSLREYADERIFKPLGMTNTHVHDDHAEVVRGRTQAYEPRDGGGYIVSIPPFDVVGTTNLHTTVEDFAKWNGNFFNPTMCSPEVLELVQTPDVFNDGSPMTYAWGLETKPWRGLKRVGHNGADHGYRSSSFHFPDLDFGIAVFANYAIVNPENLAERVAEIVLKDHVSPQTSATLDTRGMARKSAEIGAVNLVGTYTNDDGEIPMQMIISETGHGLEMTSWGEAVALDAAPDCTYSYKDGFATIYPQATDDNGNVTELVTVISGQGATYTRVPESSSLNEFVGSYYSEELDTHMNLTLNGSELLWVQKRLPSTPVVSVAVETLGIGSSAGSMRLAVDRNDQGKVAGFRLSGNRVSGIRYQKLN